MKIGVDARVILKYPGLGRYCRNIINALAEIDDRNEYTVFTLAPLKIKSRHFKVVQVDYPVLSYKTFYAFSGLINRCNFDVFLATFQVAPLNVACPMVIVLHDMMDLMYKDAFTHHNFFIRTGLRYFFKYTIPRSVNKASAIITVSESTKHDLLKYFNINDKNVIAIMEGVEEKFKPVTDMEVLCKIRQKYDLPERFVFYLGSIKPYKNLQGVLESFLKLYENGFNENVKLVIGGLKHFSIDKLYTKIEKLNIKGKVQRVGFISEEDLPAVYSLAEVFLFPSIWEGFGLPALEAMACGVPVITSNISSLPEVVGDAGIQINPYNIAEISYNLKELLRHPELRKTFSQKGIERAKLFSWKKTAEKIVEVLQEVYNKEKK